MDVQRAMQVLRATAELANELRSKAAGFQWSPQEPTGKQRDFLNEPALEALYGGAGGGGKSSALLLGALQYVDRPEYAALILRRTYADLMLPDAIMARAHEWLRPSPARWDAENKTWRFPSGATLTFGYLQHDKQKYRYQGSAYHYVAFDELTQFTEAQYRYLLSRIRRRSDSSIPLRMRSASNPGGEGHEWVHKRFVDPDTRSASFVPARLEDNPHLDQVEYAAALDKLDDTTRRQLRYGEWITDAGGLIYPLNVANMVDALPPGKWDYVLAVDLGASITTPSTVFAVWACSLHSPFPYLVESDARAMGSPGDIAEVIHRYMSNYDFMDIAVDQGGLGAGYIREFQDRYHIPCSEGQKRNKLGYRKLMRGDLQRGIVKVVESGNPGYIAEANRLRYNDKQTDCVKGAVDHYTDAGLYGYIRCYSYLHEKKESGPREGSPEAIEAEMEAIAEQNAAAEQDPWAVR